MNTQTQHTGVDAKSIDSKVLGFSTVAAILGATFAIAMSASAATPDMMNGSRQFRTGCATEQSQEIERAIENGDYASWKELMSSATGWRGRVTQVVTEDNFDTFAAMHAAMESGDVTKAAALRKELGLPNHAMGGGGHGKHQGRGMGEGHRTPKS